jgi:hypothetical protein
LSDFADQSDKNVSRETFWYGRRSGQPYTCGAWRSATRGFGVRLLAAGVVTWGQPDHIAKLPGVKWLIGWVSQGRRRAGLASTVAGLDNDIGGARETLLRDELRHSRETEVNGPIATINLCESRQSLRESERELAMNLAQEEEIRLVKDEYNRFVSGYDHDSFVLNCKIRSRLLIEDHRDGARFIADEAIRALGCSKPLLMVRIGDAEANLLRFARHCNEFELKWINAVFLLNDNQTLPIEGAKRLSRELPELLAGADIIGLRAFGPNPSDVQIRKISQAIDRKNLRGALGNRCKRATNCRLNGLSIIQRDTKRSSQRCGQTFAERSYLPAPAYLARNIAQRRDKMVRSPWI